VTVSSFALLLLFPALCQIVLKKRKVTSGSGNDGGVSMKVINNTNTTGKRSGPSPSSVPFLPNESSNSSQNRSKGSFSVKNNNVNLNNAKNLGDSKTGNIMINIDCKDELNKSELIDLEVGLHESNGSSDMLCTSKNWVELYLAIINWKWFTVSQSI
jgi:hypothetical protein